MNFLVEHEVIVEPIIIHPYQIVFSVIAFIMGALGWIYRFRPRVVHDKLIIQYVDDNLKRSIEQHEYSFTWGRSLFLRKIALPDLPFGALIDLTIQPLDLMEVKVPRAAYKDIAKKKSRKIILIDKKYFTEQQVNKVLVLITKPIPPDYRDQIKSKIYNDYIEVTNENIFEVKNYQLEVGKDLDLNKITGAIVQIQGIRFDLSLGTFSALGTESLSSLNQKGVHPILIIDSIPAKKGADMTRMRIPLS